MTDPSLSNKSFSATPSTGPTGFGTTRVLVGSFLSFLSIFSLPQGLSLLLLSLVRPGAAETGEAIGIALVGAVFLTIGILLIVSGVKRRRRARAAR